MTLIVSLGITDQVAKESSDSTASTHKNHDVDTGASSGGTAHAAAHKAAPVRYTWQPQHEQHTHTLQGPVHNVDLPEAASKEELKKRAEELNK
jgi:hypothetical protein